ncbi:CDP-alcohol phosphatidyltransferase family protein [Aurantibacter sp.]|uniref:CDP-alcohol phosphatidyltransferase family protein n=1 Tax=Aurantibacter sp. TaxID=2807103 RepID=UPI0035C791EC
MSKLPKEHQFIDLSDYGRFLGRLLANLLKNTKFTPIHVTLLFVVAGLIAVFCILKNHYYYAAFFLILKSIIDAADGELARLKNTPSYTGRYLDSVSDILLNILLLGSITYVTNTNFMLSFAAFLGLQLQGTLYNYYYVILRNKCIGGDTTSRVFEVKTPTALPGEQQKHVNIIFNIYIFLYGGFDKIIYALDSKAHKSNPFPNWFMMGLSIFGLGFQLLLIAVFLILGLDYLIIPFLIGISGLIIVFIGIRKTLLK